METMHQLSDRRNNNQSLNRTMQYGNKEYNARGERMYEV